MKGESMSPQRELQQWTRRREHEGESHRVKSFSVHSRGREIAFCRNDSEENRDVLRSEEDAPASLGSQLLSGGFFFFSFFVIKAD